MHIGAVSLEEGILAHSQLHIHVACGTTVGPSVTFVGEAQVDTGVDTRWDGDRHGALLPVAPCATARVALVANDGALPLARPTRRGNGEEALLCHSLASATTRLACRRLRAISGARARARVTLDIGSSDKVTPVQHRRRGVVRRG